MSDPEVAQIPWDGNEALWRLTSAVATLPPPVGLVPAMSEIGTPETIDLSCPVVRFLGRG